MQLRNSPMGGMQSARSGEGRVKGYHALSGCTTLPAPHVFTHLKALQTPLYRDPYASFINIGTIV